MMNNAIPFPSKLDGASVRAIPALDLPDPRIWTPEDLASFFRLSVHWVRKVSKSDDPPPRIGGVRHLRFDTHSKEFQEWIARKLGQAGPLSVDEVEGNG